MSGAEFGGVDIDLLADYIGGALAGTPDETAVATRIAEDPDWRTAYESLTGGIDLVSAELGRLGPEPMPDELAASLDAMFRNPPPAMTVIDGGDTTPRVPARRARRRLRWAAPIAVAAGLVAFVGFGVDYLAGRDSRSQDTATSAAAGSAESAASPQILSTGTNYTQATLGGAAAQTLTAPDLNAPAAPKDRSGASASVPLGRLDPGQGLQACLDAIQRANAGGMISVQSVDYAKFDGSPALIVRFTAANGAWAWASGPECGTPGSGPATLGKVPVR
ncbi:hypothetical protein HH310_24885 [Actinoplanes sp. TBRC 11911]|uniref:hypothetical protein n=1 Tax=Actinoplanes sp. TBRC 11911 TaxID=2729386 RepID=UPI00145E8CA0|nr:hypothetical protein [Actinoplanes sp. TBRC 11911]NMO54406.1 hypothetical protein [Actinoplanes sp. TBRC 11911]